MTLILIKHIQARFPNQQCSLKFMVKEKTSNSLDTPSIYPLSQQYIDMDLDVKIDIEPLDCTAELIVIAVTELDKIFLGRVDLQPGIVGRLKQNLKGITDQKGFLEIQIVQEHKHQRNNEKGSQKKISHKNIEKSDKYQSPNRNPNVQMVNSPQSWPQLGTGSIPQTPQQPEYRQLSEDLEKWILQQKLKNQQYWNRIQQNQIFSLKYKSRLQALLQQSNT